MKGLPMTALIFRMGSILSGLWLTAAPAVFDYVGPARVNDTIVGPLIVTFGVIALWEVMRGLRWLNMALAVWLMAAPWVLDYQFPLPVGNDILVGLLVLVFSASGGKRTQRFGGGWSSLWRKRELFSEGRSA